MDQPLVRPQGSAQAPQPLRSFHIGFVSSWTPRGPEPLLLGSVESNKQSNVGRQTDLGLNPCPPLTGLSLLIYKMGFTSSRGALQRSQPFPTRPQSAAELLANAKAGS